MIRTIVEGEPGIFPEPVARVMRSIGGLFRRSPSTDAGASAAPAPPDDGAGKADGDTAGGDTAGGGHAEGRPDHSGEQR